MEAKSENTQNCRFALLQELYYGATEHKNDKIEESRITSMEGGKKRQLYDLLSPDGIHFWHCGSSSFIKKYTIQENPGRFFQLCFSLSGSWKYRNAENGFSIDFKSHEYNILDFREQQFSIEFDETENVDIFVFNIAPYFLSTYLPGVHPFFSHDDTDEAQVHPIQLLSAINLPVTPAIKAILIELLHCPMENYYKKLYLRAKVVELFMIVLSHAEEYKSVDKRNAGLREEDIKKVQQAREILHTNLQNPCSLIDLAHQVGTNENYLKKHFKQFFGNTVYGYVHEMRMQEAKNMLMQDDHDINEVARLSGFKQTSYFITVFRKYFGYAPSQMKKTITALLTHLACDGYFNNVSIVGI